MFEATYVGDGIKGLMQEGGTKRREALTEGLGPVLCLECQPRHACVPGLSVSEEPPVTDDVGPARRGARLPADALTQGGPRRKLQP